MSDDKVFVGENGVGLKDMINQYHDGGDAAQSVEYFVMGFCL
jgi:hypothetical protein